MYSPNSKDKVIPFDDFSNDKHSRTVDGIEFTLREIEVLACLFCGQKVNKQIAFVLSITEKTSQIHIGHILKKIGCHSREQVIDWLKRSKKQQELIDVYNKKLFPEAVFKGALEKIAILLKKHQQEEKKESCLILYSKKKQEQLDFLKKAMEHLALLGIKQIFLIAIEEHQTIKQVLKRLKQNPSLCLCLLPWNKETSIKRQHLALDLSDILKQKRQLFSEAVFLLLGDNDRTSLTDREYVDFTNSDYYLGFLQLIKKIWTSIDIEPFIEKSRQLESIVVFEKKKKFLVNFSPFSLEHEKSKSFKNWFLDFIKQGTSKLFIRIFFCVTFILSLGVMFSSFSDSNHESVKSSKVCNPKDWNLPRQDILFIGREKLLNDLNKKLHSKNYPLSVINVCAGMGGVGKTQLALQFAHHTKHPYTFKAWFQSENLTELKHQYIEFAKTIGYRERNPSIQTALPYVKNWLSENPGWLLIYDNVNNYEEIKDFLPLNGGDIVITTRQHKWPNSFEVLDIDIMSEKESLELVDSLIKRKITEEEKNQLRELVKKAGYLPLALAQIGAYIHKNQTTIMQYFNFYEKYEQEFLAENTLSGGINNLPLMITWNITLNAIIKEEKENNNDPSLALYILSICSYLAPENISQHLLLTCIKEIYPDLPFPDLVLSKLIGLLWQYSMIKLEENGDITLHRLVQAVVRHQHIQASTHKDFKYSPLTLKWYCTLLKCIHDEFTYKTGTLEDGIRQKNMLPHLQMLLKHYKEIWPEASDFNVVDIHNDIGIVFFLIGVSKKAQFHHDLALSLLEKHYGVNHFQTADTLVNLGYVYRSLGDTNQAKKSAMRALSLLEKHYGLNHFKITAPLNCLGDAYRDAGEIREAKKIHLRALPILAKHYGTTHPKFAHILEHLAMDYRDLGDFMQAKLYYEEALKIKKDFFGENHIETAFTLDHLGRTYRNLGDIEKAKEICELALKIKENFFGKDHFELSITLDYLGRIYRSLGKTRKAKELHERSLKVKENFFGKDHFLTAFTLDQLGRDLRDLGQVEEARELHERALKIKEAVFGKDPQKEEFHIVATTLDYLASCYRILGKKEQAKNIHEQVLEVMEKFFNNPNHTAISYILDQLGNDYRDLGNAEKAKELHARALKIKEDAFDKNHIEIAFTLDQLGNDYRDLGNVENARDLHKRALKIKRNFYNADHIEVVFTLNYLSKDYEILGNTKYSKKLYEEALHIKEKYYCNENYIKDGYLFNCSQAVFNYNFLKYFKDFISNQFSLNNYFNELMSS